MDVNELFNLGNEFYNEGRVETAMEIWGKVSSRNPLFSAVHINQYNVYRNQGNLVKARESLIKFLNCPITGMSMDVIPKIKEELANLERQLNPQIVAQPPTPPPK